MSKTNANDFTFGGVRFVAEELPSGSCVGCVFKQREPDCLFSPECDEDSRDDNRNIIWVLAK